MPRAWPLLIALAACGDPEPAGRADAGTGDAGVTGCNPGELDEGGTCRPAGVPADACGEGFESDSAGGCVAVLPGAPCGPGTMALPGETACREIAPCGDGPWAPDLAVEASTEFVDGGFSGTSDGSESKPWKTIQEGVDAAAPGAVIAIAAGTYVEKVAISGTQVHLVGRCPSKVSVEAPTEDQAAISVLSGADGAEVRGVGVAGIGYGVLVRAADEVHLDRIWIHDTGATGLYIGDELGPTSVTLSGSLLEAPRIAGVLLTGSSLVVESSSVRDTRPNATTGADGVGVAARAGLDSGARATLTMTGTIVEHNHRNGVFVTATDLALDTVLVRDTLAATDGTSGRGVEVASDSKSDDPSKATIVRSVVERNRDVGIFVLASTAEIELTVVRATEPLETDGTFGRGINAIPSPAGARSTLGLKSSLIDQNRESGVFVAGSDAEIELAIVRGTRSSAVATPSGEGVMVSDGLGLPAGATIGASVVEDNEGVGVFVVGSDATLDGCVVRGTRVFSPTGAFGRGIDAQPSADVALGTTLSLARSWVHDNHDVGVFVAGGAAVLDHVEIARTAPRDDGSFGDGVLAAVGHWGDNVPEHDLETTVSIGASRIEASTRAGVASFGSSVSIGTTSLECNAFHLDGEDFLGRGATFDDLGQNACGCEGTAQSCQVVSAKLEPPAALGRPSPP